MTTPRALLAAWNIKPNKNLGQNFLSNPATAEKIISRAQLSGEEVILEIGAGLGALTIFLARAVKKVYAVEKDRQIVELLKTQLLAHRISNCEVVAKNILQMDLTAFSDIAGKKITVIGNLPYGISSQILIKLIQSRSAIERSVLMFQKELAERITAQPGGRNYGRITAMLRYCADIRILANIKSSVFYPPPKVDSTVIETRFKSTAIYGPHDETRLFEVIKAAFGNRRKTLKNALAASGLGIDTRTALEALNSAGIDPSRRAETLNPAEFVSLEISLRELMAKSEG